MSLSRTLPGLLCACERAHMRGLVRRIAMPAVIAAVVLGGLVGTASSAGAAEDPQPGLPLITCPEDAPISEFGQGQGRFLGVFRECSNNGYWFGLAQVGLTGSVKGQQWIQVPLTMSTANAPYWFGSWAFDRRTKTGDKVVNEFAYRIWAFFVSPEGSDDPYGTSAPIRVKTLAFGSIPAEVTLSLVQAREGGVPEPVEALSHDYQTATANGFGAPQELHVDPVRIAANVSVRVDSVKVDGIDSGLLGGCETGPTARLELASQPTGAVEPETGYFTRVLFDATKDWYGILGGTVEGSIDIPAFRGCKTATGDDLSPLLTAAISANDNPVSVRLGALACTPNNTAAPLSPGVNDPRDPRAECKAAASDPFNPSAENPTVVTIPKRFDLPDTPVEPVSNAQ